jgi:hypothetical protein
MASDGDNLPALDCPFYYVEEYDTIEGISLKTGVKVSMLRRINKIYGTDVFTGQRLKLYASPFKAEPSESSEPPTSSADEGLRHTTASPSKTESEDGTLGTSTSSSLQASSICTVDSSLEEVVHEDSMSGLMSSVFGFRKDLEIVADQNIVSEEDDEHARVDDNAYLGSQCLDDDDSPMLEGESKIMTKKMTILIMVYLPIVHQHEPWTLLYSLYDHGTDFMTFYSNVAFYEKTVILVETELGEVFGGFASEEWCTYHSFKGTGQCFLFKFCKHQYFKSLVSYY